jgi:hypothetical protein
LRCRNLCGLRTPFLATLSLELIIGNRLILAIPGQIFVFVVEIFLTSADSIGLSHFIADLCQQKQANVRGRALRDPSRLAHRRLVSYYVLDRYSFLTLVTTTRIQILMPLTQKGCWCVVASESYPKQWMQYCLPTRHSRRCHATVRVHFKRGEHISGEAWSSGSNGPYIHMSHISVCINMQTCTPVRCTLYIHYHSLQDRYVATPS